MSSEFPLRTQNELAEILTMYNGSNDVEIVLDYPYLDYRIKTIWIEDHETNEMRQTNISNTDPPYYSMAKGYSNAILHRKFVEYAVEDRVANVFLNWLENTYSPDELYDFSFKARK